MNYSYKISLISLSLILISGCSLGPSKSSQERVPNNNTEGARANMNAAMRSFIERTGVVIDASYEAGQEEENPLCISGSVELIPTEETFTVMLGGRSLVTGVKESGVFTEAYRERSCAYDLRVEANQNRIQSQQKRICESTGRSKVERLTNIDAQFSAQEIRYTIVIKENKKIISQADCILQKVSE